MVGAFAGMRLPGLVWFAAVVVLLAGVAVVRVRGRSDVVRMAVSLVGLCTIVAASLASASWVRVQSTNASPLVALAENGGIARVHLVTTGDPVRLRDGSGLLGGAPRGYRVTARVDTVVVRDAAVSTRSSVSCSFHRHGRRSSRAPRVEAVLRWSPAREAGLAAVGSARAGPRVVGVHPWCNAWRRRYAAVWCAPPIRRPAGRVPGWSPPWWWATPRPCRRPSSTTCGPRACRTSRRSAARMSRSSWA